MKKIVSILLIIVMIAGCSKEKIYKENLAGVWNVYKYLLNNTDKTAQFQNQHGKDYSIAFTNGGAFTEFTSTPDTTIITGTYSFEDNDEKLVLNHFHYTYTTDSIWTDSVTFHIDSIAFPHPVIRKYTIFNLTKDHVQLRNDTSQLYMNKPTP
jgi:hypothetical protein